MTFVALDPPPTIYSAGCPCTVEEYDADRDVYRVQGTRHGDVASWVQEFPGAAVRQWLADPAKLLPGTVTASGDKGRSDA